MALLVHGGLSMAYGRLADVVVMRSIGMARAAFLGALFGGALFAANRLLVAPLVFPHCALRGRL